MRKEYDDWSKSNFQFGLRHTVRKVVKKLHALLLMPWSPVLMWFNNSSEFVAFGYKGYYDVNLKNASGNKIFVHRGNMNCFSLDVINSDTGEVIRSFDQVATNMQQGARATWIENDLYFNEYTPAGDVHTCIYSSESNSKERYHEKALQSLNEKFVVYMDYSIISKKRPDYGYSDLKRQSKVAFEIRKRVGGSLIYQEEFSKDKWVNHFILSETNWVVYLERQYKGSKRIDEMMAIIISDEGVEKRPIIKGMISHYCFVSGHEILVYMSPGVLKKGWFTVNLETGHLSRVDKLRGFGDGHPSSFEGKVVFDTYPNNLFRLQSLYIWDMKNDPVFLLKRHIPPKYFGYFRCDFHPVMNEKGVYFDSVSKNGNRIIEIARW